MIKEDSHEVDLDKASGDLSQYFMERKQLLGSEAEIKRYSAIFKTKLQNYAQARANTELDQQTGQFITSLKKSLKESSNQRMIDTVGHYFTKPLVNKITQQPVEKITNKLEGILENIITHAGAKLFGNCAAEQERDKRINQDIERLKRQVEQAQNSQQKFILLQDEPHQQEESKTSGQIEESKTSGINKPGSVMIEHIGTASSAQVEGGGLKLVGEVQASSGAMAMAGGIDLSSLPLLEATGLAGLRAAGRAAPVVAGGVMAAKVINDTLEFQNQHPALYINPQEVISNPLLSKEQKHQLIEQFTNDPLISGRRHAPTGLFASHSYTKPDITWPDVVDFPLIK